MKTQLVDINEAFECLSASHPEWLNELRKNQWDQFVKVGLPRRTQEDWKYTDVSQLARRPFFLGTPEHAAASEPSIRTHCELDAREGHCLVFVDGIFSEGLSRIHSLPDGVILMRVVEAVKIYPALFTEWLYKGVSDTQCSFSLLNLALLQDGLFLYIPENIVDMAPVHLLSISTRNEQDIMSHLRNFVVVGGGSRLTFFEEYVELSAGRYFNNRVNQIHLGENAEMQYYKLQNEGGNGFHIAELHIEQQRDSHLQTHNFSLGGCLSRDDLTDTFSGAGARSALNGLYVLDNSQHGDHHTCVDHAVPDCNSSELYKGVLGGQSTAVFNGSVVVEKDAQKTEAHQLNKNLLLSTKATVNTKPALEIYADDVQCTHGATVGQLDKEALFYMQTRGVEHSRARGLLTYAFANELVERVGDSWVRRYIEPRVAQRLAELNSEGCFDEA